MPYCLILRWKVFVVGPEQPRRLALVPAGDLEYPADGLLLGVRRSRLGDLLHHGPANGIRSSRTFPGCERRDRTLSGEPKRRVTASKSRPPGRASSGLWLFSRSAVDEAEDRAARALPVSASPRLLSAHHRRTLLV